MALKKDDLNPISFDLEIFNFIAFFKKVGKSDSESGRLHREITMKCSRYGIYFLVMPDLCTFKTQCHEKKPDCITF